MAWWSNGRVRGHPITTIPTTGTGVTGTGGLIIIIGATGAGDIGTGVTGTGTPITIIKATGAGVTGTGGIGRYVRAIGATASSTVVATECGSNQHSAAWAALSIR